MKNINTLITDIYHVVGNKDGWFTEELATRFSGRLGPRLIENLGPKHKVPSLRLSQMGPRCPKQLWHSIHTPELEEHLPAWARIKFAYGHILEELVIEMAKAAGHEVTGEQDEVSVDGVLGHRDCVIDGCIVDVKSANGRSFQKFKDRTIGESDSFGYLDQLDGYAVGSLQDDLVRVKDRAYLLAVNQELGHLALYDHWIREQSIRSRVRDYKKIIELGSPPPCTCETVPEGRSGNIKLGLKASYSLFKHCCFPHLRTFIYANGPMYLTKVVRKPDVLEVDRNGKPVYN